MLSVEGASTWAHVEHALNQALAGVSHDMQVEPAVLYRLDQCLCWQIQDAPGVPASQLLITLPTQRITRCQVINGETYSHLLRKPSMSISVEPS